MPLSLFGKSLDAHQVLLVTVFTVVETITLALWLILAVNGHFLLSVGELFAGLFVEHYIATLTGKV